MAFLVPKEQYRRPADRVAIQDSVAIQDRVAMQDRVAILDRVARPHEVQEVPERNLQV